MIPAGTGQQEGAASPVAPAGEAQEPEKVTEQTGETPQAVPDPVPEAEATGEEQTETGDAASGGAADQGAGSGAGTGVRRERFSTRFPYRRVRMNPAEGLRAEAAGVLVWPKGKGLLWSMKGE